VFGAHVATRARAAIGALERLVKEALPTLGVTPRERLLHGVEARVSVRGEATTRTERTQHEGAAEELRQARPSSAKDCTRWLDVS
jgi:hypothetical protein